MRDTRQVCAFTCMLCDRVGVRDVTEDEAVRLVAAGCQSSVSVVEAHDGVAPSLTYDDLIDLHRLLESDGWFRHLEGLPASVTHPR